MWHCLMNHGSSCLELMVEFRCKPNEVINYSCQQWTVQAGGMGSIIVGGNFSPKNILRSFVNIYADDMMMYGCISKVQLISHPI